VLLGLAALSKFSALVFLPAIWFFMLAYRIGSTLASGPLGQEAQPQYRFDFRNRLPDYIGGLSAFIRQS